MSKQDIQHSHAAGDGERIRIEHVTVTTEMTLALEIVFDAFSGFARYDLWAPDVQGASHWLFVQAGGVGSRFLAYDKPGQRHLTHEGMVTELERARRFAWTAPFGEWPRARHESGGRRSRYRTSASIAQDLRDPRRTATSGDRRLSDGLQHYFKGRTFQAFGVYRLPAAIKRFHPLACTALWSCLRSLVYSTHGYRCNAGICWKKNS